MPKTLEWTLLNTGAATPAKNMEIDAHLLKKMKADDAPILHLYQWKGFCGTYGHFIDPQKYLNLEVAKERCLEFGRRPTGGGLLFHLSDYAFSVLIPRSHPCYTQNTLESYAFVNNLVAKAIELYIKEEMSFELLPSDQKNEDSRDHFCMAQPTVYDVMVQGRKIVGAAQRRTKVGLLHQGSVMLAYPPFELLDGVVENNVLQAMMENSQAILDQSATLLDLVEARHEFENALMQIFLASK